LIENQVVWSGIPQNAFEILLIKNYLSFGLQQNQLLLLILIQNKFFCFGPGVFFLGGLKLYLLTDRGW